MTPRVKGLLVLLGLGAVALLWQQLRPAAAPAAPGGRDPEARIEAAARRSARSGRRAQDEGPVREVLELRVADLEVEGGEYHAGRNPFDFYSAPPPPPPPGPTPEELAARRAAEEAARRAAQEAAAAARPAEPQAPQPPRIDIAYLGSFGPPSRRIAVFSDGESLFNVLVGDVLRRDFRLVRIGFESVDLEYVDFPELPPARLPVGAEGI